MTRLSASSCFFGSLGGATGGWIGWLARAWVGKDADVVTFAIGELSATLSGNNNGWRVEKCFFFIRAFYIVKAGSLGAFVPKVVTTFRVNV